MNQPLMIEQHHSSAIMTALKWIGIIVLILIVLSVVLGMLQGVCKKKKGEEQSPLCSAINDVAKVFNWMTKKPWWTLGIGAIFGLAFLFGGRALAGRGGGTPDNPTPDGPIMDSGPMEPGPGPMEDGPIMEDGPMDGGVETPGPYRPGFRGGAPYSVNPMAETGFRGGAPYSDY